MIADELRVAVFGFQWGDEAKGTASVVNELGIEEGSDGVVGSPCWC